MIEWQLKKANNRTAKASTRTFRFGRNTRMEKLMGNGARDAELERFWLNIKIESPVANVVIQKLKQNNS